MFWIRKKVEYQDFPLFPLDVIMKATNYFSDKIGEGGFSSIYKGRLPDGELIAVKRLKETFRQRSDVFVKEATVLSKLQHKNVVRLLGCCIEKDERILVLEYMANRSLNDVLFGSSMGGGLLEWKTRISIINGIARGLSYMHEDSRLKIIHRDIKPHNVLLDEKLNPKISDFGIAEINHEYESEGVDTSVAGTLGYIDPGYLISGRLSIKSDVFSFGILLLEITTGKKNLIFLLDNVVELRNHIWNLWHEGKELDVIDPALQESCNLIELTRCIHIGLLCVQADPEKRPTMSSVVVMLASDDVKLPQPTLAGNIPSRYVSSSYQSSSIPIGFSTTEVLCSSNSEDVSTTEVYLSNIKDVSTTEVSSSNINGASTTEFLSGFQFTYH